MAKIITLKDLKLNNTSDTKRAEESKQVRIASVDVLRGLTILLMVFVNDLGKAAPSWMLHIQPPDSDGMTLADIVFPFFLFVAGISIPLAIQAARQKGVSDIILYGHVVSRSLGLLLMGLVGVNLSEGTAMNPQLWGLLAYVSIILAWCVVPRKASLSRNVFLGLKIAGAIGLVCLLIIYRREPVATEIMFRGSVADWAWLRTSWWGILGLIGWAYFVSATLYLLLGSRREWLMAATGLLMLMFLVSEHGGFFTRSDDKQWLEPIRPAIAGLANLFAYVQRYVSFGSQLGSLPSIVMAGSILGTVLLSDSDVQSTRDRVRWSLMYALGLFVAGAMLDTFGGINKISATPTWCFWCASLATLAWLGLYLLLDVAQVSKWSVVFRPAGANPLIAYLLHPMILFVLGLSGLGGTVRAYSESTSAALAISGSIAMAMVVCLLTAAIARLGLRIRI